MTAELRKATYNRVLFSISPETAAAAAISWDQLRLFVSNRILDDAAVLRLARALGVV